MCGRIPVRSRMARRTMSTVPASLGVAPDTLRPLGEHEELLAVLPVGDEAERHRAPRTQGVDPLETLLELLRHVVGPSDDDDVLLPAADVELAVADESEVAGVEPASGERWAVASGWPK